MRQFWEFFKKK
ncbi:hypothetical protein AX774_g2811, partial [Zancudomyces culisetae]